MTFQDYVNQRKKKREKAQQVSQQTTQQGGSPFTFQDYMNQRRQEQQQEDADKRTKVANWLKSYQQLVENGVGYHSMADIDSLLAGYDEIKGYVGRFGLRDPKEAADGLKELRDYMAQFDSEQQYKLATLFKDLGAKVSETVKKVPAWLEKAQGSSFEQDRKRREQEKNTQTALELYKTEGAEGLRKQLSAKPSGKRTSDAAVSGLRPVTAEELIRLKSTHDARVEEDNAWYNNIINTDNHYSEAIGKTFKDTFGDGFDLSDIPQFVMGVGGPTIDIMANTAVDAAGHFAKGFVSNFEGIADLLVYGVGEGADLVGWDSGAEWLKNAATRDTTGELFAPLSKFQDVSGAGDTLDSVAEGVGQMFGLGAISKAFTAAGMSAKAANTGTTAAMFANATGHGISEAYQYAESVYTDTYNSAIKAGASTEEATQMAITASKEAVSDGEAWAYGVMAGTAETISEMMFSGANKMMGISSFSSMDDALAKKFAGIFKSRFMQVGVEWAIKSGAEGVEEIAAGYGSALAKKLTYMSEEDIGKLIENEKLMDQFIIGTMSAAIGQSGAAVQSVQTGRDMITGLNENEQAVIDAVVEERVAEKKEKGETVKKSKIEAQVRKEMERGEIPLETIGRVLGGETYKAYKETEAQEKAASEELAALYEGEEGKQVLDKFMENSKLPELQEQLNREVAGKVENSYLAESYNQAAQRGKRFTADLSQYEEAQRVTVRKAVESGVLNNTRATHEFVDLVAKLAAARGITFDFTTNQKLRQTGLALEGKTVNGYVDANGNITVNMNSPKYLNTVVGHEVAHVLEETELYEEFQKFAVEFGKSRKASDSKFENEYQERLRNAIDLYQNVEGYEGAQGLEKIKKEVVADLVGDYLFTDSVFLERLGEKPGLARRIYNKIKQMYRMATAGSKEARQLEQLKNKFEKMFQAKSDSKADTKTDTKAQKNTAQEGGVRYSLNDGTTKNATDLSRTDLRYLLEQAQNGVLSDGSYIPLRRNTPEFFAEVVNDHSKGAVVVEDYPMASTVRHLRQNMEEEDGQSYGNERPHGFSVDDIITISEKMGDPSYIVLQKNGRYAEVVSFYNKKNKRVVVAVDFAVTDPGESKNYKYAHELNGYNDGFYNIVVTQYEPDNFAEYLEDCEIIYNKKEMNGRYQVGSGRVVAVTHDTPFIEDIVPQDQPGVNGKLSLSSDSTTQKAYGDYRVSGEDVLLDRDLEAELQAAENVAVAENATTTKKTVADDSPNLQDIADRSVFGSFYGRPYEQVREYVDQMIDEGIPLRVDSTGTYGEYSWEIHRHSYGPYAEVYVVNNLTGKRTQKSINTTSAGLSSTVKGLIRKDALGMVSKEGEQVQAEKTPLEVFMEEQIRRQEEEEKSRDAFWKAVMQSGEETESVGAAPSGFDPVSHLQYEYGSLPEGEKAVREDSLPKSTTGKDRVSLTARTVKGAKVTPDAFVDLLDQEVVGGKLSYLPVSNNEVTQKAIDYITEEGWEAARGSWSAQVRSGKVSAELTAMGALLLNNAAKAGDRQTWLDVLHDYQIMSTNAGQAVQALRILKTLTPSDNLYMAQKTIRQMVRELKLKKDVQIDEALESAYLAAETDKVRDDIMAQIQQDIADQIPSTLMDKWTALRYLNMLGNPRTQIRNLVGNTVMGLTTEVKNLIATCLETAGYVASGGRLQRTKSVFVSKGLLEAAFADYSTVKTIVSNGGKYNDQTVGLSDFASGIQDKRRIFKTNFKNDTARKILNVSLAPVEGYRKLTSWSMENGDVPFSKFAYARALSGYLKKHGFKGTDLSKVDAKLMEDARLYAVKEAQEATFHDMNAISKALSKRYHGDNGLLKVLNVFAEGVMPFRKTPANIAVRAVEYSPLGFINSLVKSGQAMWKKSDVTAADAINSWAKTLTGSGLFLLGMLLAAGGNLTGGPDDDEALDQFGEMYGQQNYALKLGDWYVTIDWASPAAIPLLMGAQWHDQMEENGFQFKDIEKVLTSVLDPLVEMSMMQGFNDALENIQYAENNLIQLVINSSLGYFTQGLTNTFMGQAERSFEDSRTSTYVDKEGDLPDWLQRLLGKNSAKTPGWDYNQIPYINAWGEEQENPDVPINMAYNMLSPSYVSESKEDGVYRELVRLNGAQDENVFPSTPSKEYEDRYLTADEYVALAKTQGQKQKELVYAIVENKTYQAMNDTDKAKVIKFAYKYAKEYAQIEVLGRKSYSAKWLNEIKGDVVAAIIAHVKED